MTYRVLLIEDDKVDQRAFERLVRERDLPYEYTIADSVSEAKKILDWNTFDVVIADHFLGDGTAFDVFGCITNTPIVFATGTGDEEIATKAMKAGAYDYLIKDPERNYLSLLPVTLENAIKQQKASQQFTMLSHAIKSISDSVFITDMDDRIIFVNEALCRTYGYSTDILGKHSLVLWRGESAAETGGTALQTPQSSDAHGEVLHRRRDGSAFTVSLSRSLVKDSKGKTLAAVTVARDITGAKRVEAELRQAREAAEAAARAKSGFLANMSHEIRTPMNGVIGMARLLLETDLNPEQRDYVETIRKSGDLLLTIINDILDYSKIESGKLELEVRPFDLRECVESSVAMLAPKAADKGLELVCDIDGSAPDWLYGDVTRVRQILLNLLSNAVKFTSKGEVVASVTTREIDRGSPNGHRDPAPGTAAREAWVPRPRTSSGESTSPKYELHFAVKDTGIGIRLDCMNRLFESFSQLDPSTTRHYGGTGLGLAISKRLCELMGGSIWVESTVGRGSTFHFTILAEDAPGVIPESRRGNSSALAGKRVLIVDDNVTSLQQLARQIASWGMIARATSSSHEALDWIQRDDTFDVCLLDVGVQEVDGITLAAEMRKHSAELPLVMMTSLGESEVQTVAFPTSVLLPKPIKASRLYDVFRHLFEEDTSRATRAPTQQQNRPQPAERLSLRILLAEDNLVNQKVAVCLLERMGYRADVATNGLEVLQALERRTYDVVLMDVQMPRMDGLETTRRICLRWPRPQRPRIIAMTANAMQGDRDECLAAGMDDYLSKPIQVEGLQAALQRCRCDGETPPS